MTKNHNHHASAFAWLSWSLAAGFSAWLIWTFPTFVKYVMADGWLGGRTVLLVWSGIVFFQVVKLGFWFGLATAPGLIAIATKSESALRAPAIALAALGLLPLPAYFAGNVCAAEVIIGLMPATELGWWLAGMLLAGASVFWWLRHGQDHAERLRARLTKKSKLERNQRTDVREIDAFLPPKIGAFDALEFVCPELGLFVGLNENRQPVYIDSETWRLSHVLLSGRTRSGKGVASQILLSQAIQMGEFVTVLDPKNDAHMPHVFRAAALRADQPYVFLDLRPGKPAQINLFACCDEETVENMLIGAFSLAEKGEAADFYRLADRKAAREAAAFIAAGHTAAEALAKFGSAWLNAAPGFHAALEEMCDLQPVNAASSGIDIDALARTGGCLYVVGDMGNTRVIRMQRMLLIRLMMLAKQGRAERLMTVLADEFKVHISRPFMTSLGAAAGWGMHVILAFQSLQDLRDCPADLDPDMVRGAVMENCAIQLSYRIKDPETAEWLAKSTGTILVDDEIRRVERNLALAETVLPERTIRQAERAFIDTNMLMNLPAGCGVLTGATKLPSFCYTSPVISSQDLLATTPTPAAMAAKGAAGPAFAGKPAKPSAPAVAEDFL